MFVRRRNNKSGSISVFVVDKSRGGYDIVKSFGTVKTAAEADLLENKAREFVREQSGEPDTLFERMDEKQLRDYAATLDQGRIELAGPELLYGELFDRLRLGEGEEPMFRHLVLCRLFNPGSKLRVRDYLQRYLGEKPSPEEIYGYVDCLFLADQKVSDQRPECSYVLSTPLPKYAFCLLVTGDGSPVAGRLLDKKLSAAKQAQVIQRFARKAGAAEPVRIIRRGGAAKQLAAAFKMSRKDQTFKPMLRRTRGRLEGHLSICMAALAVEKEWSRQLEAAGLDCPPAQLREAARTLFRLNYISPYTHRPKSVLLKMTPLQKSLLAAILK